MRYWVYEDDPTNRVRIHEASCRYCNDGRGRKVTRLPDNRWHGPFQSLRDAVEEVKALNRDDMAGCGACLPGLASRQ